MGLIDKLKEMFSGGNTEPDDAPSGGFSGGGTEPDDAPMSTPPPPSQPPPPQDPPQAG